jgi:hypothetical protein
MRMPGFSAEASIYRSSAQYRGHARHTISEAGTIEPAMHWGEVEDIGCVGSYRCRRAILWDIPWGMDWHQACWTFPHHQYGYPDSCFQTFYMNGEWCIYDCVCDPNCEPPLTCFQLCFRDCRNAGGSIQDCVEGCFAQCPSEPPA